MNTTPLGMHEDYLSRLNSNDFVMLEQLSKWPLEILTHKLIQSGIFADNEDIDRHCLTYRQFMFFKGGQHSSGLNPENICAMYSPKVDTIWHTHILFTKEYANFCTTVFGRFIHHTPCDILDMSQVVIDLNNWLHQFQKAFGDVPEDFDWERFPIQCG
jgi:hypothetical protein